MAKELEVLLNSKIMPRLLNLFFQNEEKSFTLKEVSKKLQKTPRTIKKEIEKLLKIKLLSKKKEKKEIRYFLNQSWPFFEQLKSFIVSASPISLGEIKKILERIPRVKILFISGCFLNEKKAPTDILIVGDNVPSLKASGAIRKIEGETGKEIRWTLMSLKEFEYRYQINDRFLRDLLFGKNKIVINKIKWRP
jgi:predicted transcriptional regulator